MGRRGGKNRNAQKPNTTCNCRMGRHNNSYWQTADRNERLYQYYINLIMQMAMSRFRWLNLPPTCDERYLEWILCLEGVATIAFIIMVQEIGSKNFSETGVWICVAFIGIYCLALGILKNDKYPAIAAAALVLCSVCAEYTVANTNNYSMDQTKTNFVGDYDNFQEIKDKIDEYEGNESYRMELTSLRARMDPCWYYYNGVSTFTSMAYESVANMQSNLGMFSNFINSYTYHRQTPVYNAFFSLDYIVDNFTGSKAPMNPKLYKELFIVDKYTAYENLYQLPIAFRVNEEMRYWSHDNSNPFEVQSQLFGSATGIHTVYNDIEITDISGTGASCNDMTLSDSGCYPYTVEDTAGASLTFGLEVKESGNAYVYLKTIFELNKKYNFTKFIIVVPSIAIKEGGVESYTDYLKKGIIELNF